MHDRLHHRISVVNPRYLVDPRWGAARATTPRQIPVAHLPLNIRFKYVFNVNIFLSLPLPSPSFLLVQVYKYKSNKS